MLGNFGIVNRLVAGCLTSADNYSISMWATLKELEPIDNDLGRAIRDSTPNPLLAKAWKEGLEWKSLDHWKIRLQAQRLNDSIPGVFKKESWSAGKMPKDRKRKGTTPSKYPPGYHNEELDDEEPGDVFLSPANATGLNIKQEFNSSISSDEIDALYGDADTSYPTPFQSSKRSKLDLSGRSSARPLTPFVSRNSRPMTATPFSLRHDQSAKERININE